ncbi:unnamed protein product [Lota lota]
MSYRLHKVFELRLVLSGETSFQDCLIATLDSCIHMPYASTVQGRLTFPELWLGLEGASVSQSDVEWPRRDESSNRRRSRAADGRANEDHASMRRRPGAEMPSTHTAIQ